MFIPHTIATVAAAGTSLMLQLTVPIIQTATLLPGNKVHIQDNTGEAIDRDITVNGVEYTMINCSLPQHVVIDTVCDLQLAPLPSPSPAPSQ